MSYPGDSAPLGSGEESRPPITLDSIMSFAWGLTLTISQEQSTQGKLGIEFLNFFNSLRKG